LDRRSKFGRFHSRNEGEDCLQILERQRKRRDRRRTFFAEGLRDVRYLGKGGMRIQHKERLKSVIPIGECPEKPEGRRRSNAVHPVLFVHNVAAATERQRQRFSHRGVAFETGLHHHLFYRDVGAEHRRTFGLEGLDGSLSNIGQEPVGKAVCVRPFFIGKLPEPFLTPENRDTFGPKRRFGDVALGDDRNSNPCFKRKPRQKVLEKPSFDKDLGGAQPKRFFLGSKRSGEKQNGQNEKQNATQILCPRANRINLQA